MVNNALTLGSCVLSLGATLLVLGAVFFGPSFRRVPGAHAFVVLLIYDFFYALFFLLASLLVEGSYDACVGVAAALQFFTVGAFLWSGLLSCQILLEARSRARREPFARTVFLGVSHAAVIVVSLATTLGLLFSNSFGPTDIQCWLVDGRLQMAFAYSVIGGVFLVNLVAFTLMYRLSGRVIEITPQSSGYVMDTPRSAKRKTFQVLLIYVLSFFGLWIVPFLHRLLQLFGFQVSALSLVAGFLAPLQGLVDCVIFAMLLHRRKQRELGGEVEYLLKPAQKAPPAPFTLGIKILVVVAFVIQSAQRGSLSGLVHLLSPEMPPLFTNAMRTFMGTACFGILILAYKAVIFANGRAWIALSPATVVGLKLQSTIPLDMRTLLRCFAFGMLQSQIANILLAFSAPYAPSPVSTVLIATTPLFAVILGRVTNTGAKVTWTKVGAVVTGIVGAAVVTLGSIVLGAQTSATIGVGVALSALAAIVWAVAGIYGGTLADIPQIPRALLQLSTGGIVCMITSLIWEFGFGLPFFTPAFESHYAFAPLVEPYLWAVLFALSFSTVFLGMLCLLFLLDRVGAVVATCTNFVVPVFGLLTQLATSLHFWDNLAAWQIAMQVLGCLVILGSMVLLVWTPKAKPKLDENDSGTDKL
jgi:drug/metabolite transporter (DMT)-like permease